MDPCWNTQQIRQYLHIDDNGNCLSMSSYSQLGQDLAVLSYFNNKQGGYYVDIGAHDGICFSNTYLLEKNHQWTGICVEPLPENFTRLGINRPKSICVDNAVYSISGLTIDLTVADMFSGICNYVEDPIEALRYE